MGRTTQWYWGDLAEGAAGNNRLRLRLGIDIYNASDTRPDRTRCNGSACRPAGRSCRRRARCRALAVFDVRETMEASFDLTKITPAAQQPSELAFIDGFKNAPAC